MSTGHKIFNGRDHEEKRRLNKLNKVNYEKIDDSEKLCDNAKDLIKRLLVADPENRLNMQGVIEHPYFKNFSFGN